MTPFFRHSAVLAVALLSALSTMSCDDMSTLGGGSFDQGVSGVGDDASAGGDGAPAGDGGGGAASKCDYADDASFCACMGWSCGGITATDRAGQSHPVYCGACPGDQYCQSAPDSGGGVGTCGGTNPLAYAWQKQKIDMLVAIGENDNTKVNYDFVKNIGDGRGYTVGKVGFCTGTGDFILVAACYNDRKPGNVLSRYWGHVDASGKAKDGLVYYNDAFLATGENQAETKLIDSLGPFAKDVVTAAGEADGIFRGCQDAMADALYLSTAVQHADERGLKGALTIGFLYDTELNFGDDDDPAGVLGAKSVMAKADADYGAGLPADFTGKAREESRWLGYLIKERVIEMSKDATWKGALDQNATWEGARRLHTGAASSAESATSLDMDYDFVSKYKAGATTAGTPCWPTGLASAADTQATIFVVRTDKAASAADPTKWKAEATSGGTTFAACPANPTP